MKEENNRTEANRRNFIKKLGTLVIGVSVLPISDISKGCMSPDKKGIRLKSFSLYNIIIPTNASAAERTAAETLKVYLSKLSGINPEILDENNYHDETGIYIGSTQLSKKVQTATTKLEADGFSIGHSGKNLIITGGAGEGVLYGVYNLLEILGFRKYSSTSLLVPEEKQFFIPSNSIYEVPYIRYRTTSYHDSNNKEYSDWHRLSSRSQWGMFVHTFQQLIPPDKYGKPHPEYFSLIDGKRNPVTQLCLSNDEVFHLLVDELKKRIEANPEARYWSVSQNDNDQYCRCDKCAALNEKYGGVPSGSIIWFVNKVAKEFPDNVISTLAYWYSRSAPKSIEIEPNVNIMLCNIESTREKPVFETDPAFTHDLQDWGKLAKDIIIWDYNIQFASPVAPFPNLHTIGPNIQFYTENNVKSLFMQATGDKGEFAHLRAYLIAKLMWNPEANPENIIDDFVNGYYGPAGRYIREYIDRMKTALLDSQLKLNIFGYPRDAASSYLSLEMMHVYKKLFDQAEKAVMNNPEYVRRVKEARLPIQFAEIEIGQVEVDTPRSFYAHDQEGKIFVKPEMKTLVNDFIEGAKKRGIKRVRERAITVDDYKENFERIYSRMNDAQDALSFGKTITSITVPKNEEKEVKRLTDGIFGSFETWRNPDSNWVCYEGNHMDFILDLGDIATINSVTMDFLNAQAQADWNVLVLPRFVTYSISNDGKKFNQSVRITNPHNPDPAINPEIIKIPYYTFTASFQNRKARFIKVHAESLLKMPSWHIHAGEDAQIYADEIVVK